MGIGSGMVCFLHGIERLSQSERQKVAIIQNVHKCKPDNVRRPCCLRCNVLESGAKDLEVRIGPVCERAGGSRSRRYEMLTCFSHRHFFDIITGSMVCQGRLA